jgi:hypothetical protein
MLKSQLKEATKKRERTEIITFEPVQEVAYPLRSVEELRRLESMISADLDSRQRYVSLHFEGYFFQILTYVFADRVCPEEAFGIDLALGMYSSCYPRRPNGQYQLQRQTEWTEQQVSHWSKGIVNFDRLPFG